MNNSIVFIILSTLILTLSGLGAMHIWTDSLETREYIKQGYRQTIYDDGLVIWNKEKEVELIGVPIPCARGHIEDLLRNEN